MADKIKPSAVVIIGVGGMGLAIAKRIGAGRRVILADFSEAALQSAQEQLEGDGYVIQWHTVDVSDVASVKKLAADSAEGGRIEAVVHTAGLSPTMAPSKKILEVDLLGTANVIEAFADALTPGASMVCIASMAGHGVQGKLPSEIEQHLARAPVDQLLAHPVFKSVEQDPGHAYGLSKRGNQLRVEAAACQYGKRACRINSISPGVIHTPMAKQELNAPHGQVMRGMVEDSATGRYGTPSDIANAVAFLIGPDASFITGTDLLVDGGSTAAQRWATATSEDIVGDAA